MPEFEDWLNNLKGADAEKALYAASHPPKKQERVLRKLALLLKEEDPNLRWLAARSLAEFESDKAGGLLMSALNDNDPSVQHCAAIGLREAPHSLAIDTLVSYLGHQDQLLSRLCGDALIAQGEEAIPALLTVLQNAKIDSAKVEAARALATIADHHSISALFELLDSDSALLAHWAEVGLDKMGVGMQFFEPR